MAGTNTYTNLNDGTGNPWAGHNNGKLNFSRALNPRILSRVARVENLGDALPTGSNRRKMKLTNRMMTMTRQGTPRFRKKKILPKRRNREPLCRAQEGIPRSQYNSSSIQFVINRWFRYRVSNRFFKKEKENLGRWISNLRWKKVSLLLGTRFVYTSHQNKKNQPELRNWKTLSRAKKRYLSTLTLVNTPAIDDWKFWLCTPDRFF